MKKKKIYFYTKSYSCVHNSNTVCKPTAVFYKECSCHSPSKTANTFYMLVHDVTSLTSFEGSQTSHLFP